MKTDLYTKAVLTIIAACLLGLVFRDVPMVTTAHAEISTVRPRARHHRRGSRRSPAHRQCARSRQRLQDPTLHTDFYAINLGLPQRFYQRRNAIALRLDWGTWLRSRHRLFT